MTTTLTTTTTRPMPCHALCTLGAGAAPERAASSTTETLQQACLAAVTANHMQCLKALVDGWTVPLTTECKLEAIRRGHIGVLKYLRQHEQRWSASDTTLASYTGQYDCLEYMLQDGAEAHAGVICAGAITNQLRCIELAVRANGELTQQACANAAANGHLSLLKTLRSWNCPWTSSTVEYAALSGQEEVVRWALASGCESTEQLVLFSIKGRSVECLKLALGRHPQLSAALVTEALLARADACLWFLVDAGCPVDDTVAFLVVELAVFHKRNAQLQLLVHNVKLADSAVAYLSDIARDDTKRILGRLAQPVKQTFLYLRLANRGQSYV